MKIAHIINPVKVSTQSDLFVAQPITFETMRRAGNFDKNLEVDQYYTCYDEDLEFAPVDFTQARLLKRSILDMGTFEVPKKLPLIRDILDALYEASDAEYFIYTNVDIAVMPHFYAEIAMIINDGYDGFVINRRTISDRYKRISSIPKMYSEIGEKHPGFDCFVFKREAYDKYTLGDACIGANWIGRVLISNVIAYADKFKVFEDEHLTFHLGDDRSWKVEKYLDYDRNNERELVWVLNDLMQTASKEKTQLQKFLDDHQKNIQKNCLTVQEEETLPAGNPFRRLIEQVDLLDQSPVFIVGFPRSGTTLMQSLIATQGIVSFPETHFFNYIVQNLHHEQEQIVDSGVKICEVILKKINLSEEASEFIKAVTVRPISRKLLFEIIVLDQMMKQVGIEEIPNIRWLEKTPGHTMYLQQLIKFYPQAKFIFMLRNPVNAFESWRSVSQYWGIDWYPMEKYSEIWLQHLEHAKQFQKQSPHQILFTRLEDVVEDTLAEMKKICTFLNILLDLEKLQDRQKNVEKLISSNEVWKKDVNQEISKVISERDASHNLTVFEQYRIHARLGEALKELKYNTETIDIPEDNALISFSGEMKDLKFFENMVEEKDEIIKERGKLYDVLALKDEELKDRDTIIKERGKLYDVLALKDEELKDRQKIIEEKDEIIKERGKLYDVLALKDEELKNRQKIIEEKDEIIKERGKLYDVVKEQDNKLKSHKQIIEDLYQMVSTNNPLDIIRAIRFIKKTGKNNNE